MAEHLSPGQSRLAGKSVGVIDASDDSAELLKSWFEFSGARVAATTQLTQFRLGHADIREWLHLAAPDVVIYDIGPPYEANWTFLQQLREGPLRGVPLVVTTTNEHVLRALIGQHPELPIHELIGKPVDLDALAACVTRMMGRPASE